MRQAIDMTGEQIGMLLVVSRAEGLRGNGAVWNCICVCGETRAMRRSDLIRGSTVSCGCFNKVKRITHGRSGTPAYYRWMSMIDRCTNPNNKSYWRYGARGIQVCERWMKSFADFLADVGECPPGMSLDRWPNHAGNYEPGNVRWATPKQQARNTRRNHLHTMNGETRCLAERCEITGEPWTTVKKRVAAGRDPFERLRSRRKS